MVGGAGDFFNDLAKELEAAEKERAGKGAKPKSLWEELAVGTWDYLRQLYGDARVNTRIMVDLLLASSDKLARSR